MGVKVQMHTNIHKYMYTVCVQPTITKKRSKRLHSLFPHTDKHTHMQWTHKQGQGISQSDPYHYLPCKAHLTGRPGAQTSAIFTHFLSCVRSPQLHLVCEALWHGEPKSQKTTYSNGLRGSWNHSTLNTVSADDQHKFSDVATPTQRYHVSRC